MGVTAGKLSGRVALVTGAASGIGFAIAKLFAQEGCKVIVTDQQDGTAVANEIRSQGGEACYYHLDVTSEDEWKQVIQSVEKEYGALHILVNCAGINVRYTLTEMDLEDWKKILDVDLTGPMLGMRAVAPLMKTSGHGSIINIGSLAAMMGHPTTAYAAAKWGLRGLSKSAALELVDWGIRVNTIHPGIIRTPIIDVNGPLYKTFVKHTPLGRGGRPEEIAATALFLASDDSSFITGIDIPVDGGFSELTAYRMLWKASQADGQIHRD